MFKFIKKLFNKNLPYQLNVDDYVVFPTMIADCFGEYMDALNLCFYSAGKVISEPKFEDGDWLQLISFDEDVVPDQQTFENTKWKETDYPYPPAHWFYLKKKNKLIKTTKEGYKKADFISAVENGCMYPCCGDPVFFADKDDSEQNKYLLEEVDEKRKNLMKKCWQKWMERNEKKTANS